MVKTLQKEKFLLNSRSTCRRREFTKHCFLIISSIVFCLLLAAFLPVNADKSRRASEEKSSEYIQETIDVGLRVADSGDGGDSGFHAEILNLISLFDFSLETISQPSFIKPLPLNLPLDPRSCWESDSSPPATVLS